MRVALRPAAVTTGSSAWCSKRGSVCRWLSGSATQSWAPCRKRACDLGLSSEWLMARPEVISPSSRGRMVARLPVESRCSTSPDAAN